MLKRDEHRTVINTAMPHEGSKHNDAASKSKNLTSPLDTAKQRSLTATIFWRPGPRYTWKQRKRWNWSTLITISPFATWFHHHHHHHHHYYHHYYHHCHHQFIITNTIIITTTLITIITTTFMTIITTKRPKKKDVVLPFRCQNMGRSVRNLFFLQSRP